MLSSLFLLYRAVRWIFWAVLYCLMGFVKWFVLLLLWLVDPQKALEAIREMEADDVHEQR